MIIMKKSQYSIKYETFDKDSTGKAFETFLCVPQPTAPDSLYILTFRPTCQFRMIVITNTTNGRSVLKADSSGNTGLEAYKRHFTTALISKQILTLSNVD